jgi:tetratricopeptide (TPR) repeat protein
VIKIKYGSSHLSDDHCQLVFFRSEAKLLYAEALAMRKRLLGCEHPDVAKSLNNLALLYRFQGRYSEAEPLFVEALAMSKLLLGDGHPQTATTARNLEICRTSKSGPF